MNQLIEIDKTDILPGGLSRVQQINDAYIEDMLLVLASIDAANIEALIRGKPRDFVLQKLPEDVASGQSSVSPADERPTIYLHYLVDNNNHPPTPQEWKTVLKVIEEDYVVGYEDFLNSVPPVIPAASLNIIRKIESRVGNYKGDPITG